jgi:glycosyltransferase involved in cell wall biosynthesis
VRAPGSEPIAVVLTVLDDREDLQGTLTALDDQRYAPDELIFVDGGSTDGTRELLAEWTGSRDWARVLDAPGTNISEGRNLGVEEAAAGWIACTDAGCRPDPGWLEAFATARAGSDFLAGVWIVDGHSAFERCVGIAGHPAVEEIESPSVLVRVSQKLFGRSYSTDQATGRSMAFTRRAWEAAGRFPTRLYAGEDVAFSRAVHEAGMRTAMVPMARVRWRPRGGWVATARMYFSYARGDIRTPPRRAHTVRAVGLAIAVALLVLLGPVGLIPVAAGVALYLAHPYSRAIRSPIPSHEYIWRIPLLVAHKDLANLAGAGVGLIDMALGRRQPRPGGI